MEELLPFVARHPLLFTALAVVILLLVINEVVGVVRGGKRLTPAEAIRAVNDRGARFVDVRTPADFKRGHIIGAINVPASRIDERFAELEKLRAPIIVCCALGAAAPAVVDKLRRRGLADAHALRGGVNSWQSAGLPLTTAAAESRDGGEGRRGKGKRKGKAEAGRGTQSSSSSPSGPSTEAERQADPAAAEGPDAPAEAPSTSSTTGADGHAGERAATPPQH